MFKAENNLIKNNTAFTHYLLAASKINIKLYTFQKKEALTIVEETKLKNQHHFYYNTSIYQTEHTFANFKQINANKPKKLW